VVIPLKLDSVVSVTINGGVVAIRLLQADMVDDAKTAPLYALASDATGLANHAARLTLRGGAMSPHTRMVFLVAAADADSAGDMLDQIAHAEVKDDLDGDTWRVSVKVGSLNLEVDRSATDRLDIAAQRVNGKDVEPMILGVNGKDLAADVWKELTVNP
jgi:hypothetical protein